MWQGSLIQHLFIFILVYFFGKTPKFSIIMHKWCYKGVPGNSYSKTSHDIIQSGDFIKNKIVNKRENQSATDIVADVQNTGNSAKQRFLLHSYSKHNSKHYDIFLILRHLLLPPAIFKKIKKKFHRLLLHIFNMK